LYKNNRAGPGRNYILALVVSVAIAPSAGAAVPAAAVSVLMVQHHVAELFAKVR
jgi:uncharacterized membrane protein YqgA involved in biofilm formation